MKLDVDLDVELSQAIHGYEKDINELKKEELMKPEEGKSPLKMNGYKMLATKMMLMVPCAIAGSWPYILFTVGYDFAGVIYSVGTSDTAFSVGDEAFGISWGQHNHDETCYTASGS